MLQANPAMGGHARRGSGLARSVALALKLNPDRRRLVFYAATLHDLSLIGREDDWKSATGPEWEQHPARSAVLIATVPNLNRISAAVAAHHEHFDGSGFPEGLKGEKIPLESRIIAAVVAYDRKTAITGENREDALGKMKESGHYDPVVLGILETIIRDTAMLRKSGDRLVGTEDLTPGMVLADDLILHNGLLLFPQDTNLDAAALDRIRSFDEMLGKERLIRVYPGI